MDQQASEMVAEVGDMMRHRIEVNPSIHFGKPCVSGTRIPVVDVLELVQHGLSFETIAEDYYPGLDAEDIAACIRYAIEVVDVEELNVAVSS